MLLDRIDIDAHGPLQHVELGPFAEHLNVILGPQGSGKTAIIRFVRDSLIRRDYPQGMLSASSGRVVWADRNGLVHCRREQDGTVAGRRTVEFESRGETLRHLDSLSQSWFGDKLQSSDSSRAIQSLQLPESIVDGVVTDTAINSVSRVISACVRSGLDSPKTFESLPLHDDSTYHARDAYSPLDPVTHGIDQRDYDRNRRLRQQLAEVEAELSRLQNDNYPDSYQRAGAFVDSHASYATTTTRRIDSLRRRRAEILDQLRVVERPVVSRSPLSDAASGWLVRLTAGRLRRVAWPDNMFRDDRRSYHRESYQRNGVTIDGRDEQACPASDRAATVLAVRMAAGDLLASTGRHVPLVLETDGDFFKAVNDGYAPLAYYDNGDLTRSNCPIAAALRDYTRAGRQVVLFTSNQSLAAQLSRVGARNYRLYAQPVVHAHRPLWKPHYSAEHYVGPHPHTYGPRGADEVLDQDFNFYDSTAGPIQSSMNRKRPAPVVDINRDFDMAWHEAYGLHDSLNRGSASYEASERTDWSRDGSRLRDGYYTANAYTTNEPIQQGCCDDEFGERHACCQHQKAKAFAAPVSPFFLTVDSPIDQAPSIDAVAAARLRGLKVTHVNHLMQQDSNRLADALGLASVDASTIRRWQAECRLVCRVPQLRGFDARVLVGCGVTTPAQLAAIHPVDLLQQVEAFLATGQGQKILLSGSSHELSRITSWIAAANTCDGDGVSSFGHDRLRRTANDLRRRSAGRTTVPVVGEDSDDDFDSLRYEYETGVRDLAGRRSGLRGRRRLLRDKNRASVTRNGLAGLADTGPADDTAVDGLEGPKVRQSNRSSSSSGRSLRSGSRSNSRSSNRSSGESKSGRSQSDRSSSGRHSNRQNAYAYGDSTRGPREYETRERANQERSEREPLESRDSNRELRFYLQRESLVLDAPSIGARMAERLNAIGICTVDDLLNADADTVATELDHRQVDADTVLQWQQQATLVCRVPMLRGHDAQLLVAAEVTTPEELAQCDAGELLGVVDTIARSNDGQRILRGGKRPDLAEVTDWINYGRQHRELMAA